MTLNKTNNKGAGISIRSVMAAFFSRRRAVPAVLLGGLVSFAMLSPLHAATSDSMTTVQGVKVVRETAATSTVSTTWVDVPGATVSFGVPVSLKYLYIARFTAESACSGASGWCSVRILLTDSAGYSVEMNPVVGAEYAFDSTGSASDWEGHAVDRSQLWQAHGYLLANVTLKVQYKVSAPGMTFRLDDWHFTVMQGN